MRLYCPSCGEVIDSMDIDVPEGIAKCDGCAVEFGFLGASRQHGARTNRVLSSSTAATDSSGCRTTGAPGPKNISVLKTNGCMRLVRTWESSSGVRLLVLAIFWDSLLIGLFCEVLTDWERPRTMLLFLLGHVAAGAVLTYTALCGVFNRTTIDVAAGWLRVRHAPLPWRGNRVLPVALIDRLARHSMERRCKSGKTVVTYVIHAYLRNGERVKLLPPLEALDEALFIEREIKRRIWKGATG